MNKALRTMLAAATLLFVTQWSRPAAADVTITGTVGEIGAKVPPNNIAPYRGGPQVSPFVRFKFTDANQTAACTEQFFDNNLNQAAVGWTGKYAYFWDGGQDAPSKEWFTMLLMSKKGASLTCTVTDANNCHITGCTLN